MNLSGIQSNKIDEAWPLVEPLVLKALVKTGSIDDYGPKDIKDLCKSRKMQCWVAHDGHPVAVCVTRIMIFPKRKVFSIFLCASEDNTFNDWWAYNKTLIDYGISNGCTALRLGGRRGWVKLFNAKNETVLFTIPIGDQNG